MSIERISAKLCRWSWRSSGPTIAHWCPACGALHEFACDAPFYNGARWTWDGNADRPTFSPSMHIRVGPFEEDGHIEVCHYFLRDGRIQFLGDCTHALAGQTVDLPDIPAEAVA